MRNARGQFLPLCGAEADDGRHVLSRAERAKGYATLMMRIALGRIPSRIASSIRSKIRRHFCAKAEQRRRSA
jgi:hypothetical protein